jgi:hypothetical protein
LQIPLVNTDATFKAFPHLNKMPVEFISRSRVMLGDIADKHFGGDVFTHKIVRALGETRVIGLKEVLESFEFYARVRRRIRSEHVADLCCGHGLVGMLFAVLQRGVHKVTLMDVRRPENFDVVLNAVASVAPWVAEKVTYAECKVDEMGERLSPGTSILGVHACGGLTDQCLRIARELNSRVAVMPCCYGNNHMHGPKVLERMLGGLLAVDVDRTYRMESHGYTMDWQFIPQAILPMNRILVGEPPAEVRSSGVRDLESIGQQK